MISVPAVAPSISDTVYSALVNAGGLSFTSPIVITAATLELLCGTPRSDTTTVRLYSDLVSKSTPSANSRVPTV